MKKTLMIVASVIALAIASGRLYRHFFPPPPVLPATAQRSTGPQYDWDSLPTRIALSSIAANVKMPEHYAGFELGFKIETAGTARVPLTVYVEKSPSQAGPYDSVNERLLEPQGGFNPTFHVRFGELSHNWLWYRVSVGVGRHPPFMRLPAFRMPIIANPAFDGDALTWPPRAAGPAPEATLHFSVVRGEIVLPVVYHYGAPPPPEATAFAALTRLRAEVATSVPGNIAWKEGEPLPTSWPMVEARWKLPYPPAPRAGGNLEVVLPALFRPDGFLVEPADNSIQSKRVYYEDLGPDGRFDISSWKVPEQQGDTTHRADQRRTVVGEFMATDGTSVQVKLELPPLPLSFTAIGNDGEAVITWDATPFIEHAELYASPPRLLVFDGGRRFEVDATAGRYVDLEVRNDHTFSYNVHLLGDLKGTAWVRGLGEVPATTRIDQRIGKTNDITPGRRLPFTTVALGMSELCYSDTGLTHIMALAATTRKLLSTPGIVLLDRVNVPNLLGELRGEAAALLSHQQNTMLPASHLLRFSDYSTFTGKGVGLWLTEVTNRQTQPVGHATAPGSAEASLREKLAQLVVPLAKPPEPPRQAELPVSALVFGSLEPVEQPVVVAACEALADELMVSLATALPEIAVISREQLKAVLTERALKGADGVFLSGEVLLSGRVWHANEGGDLGYFFTATDIGTGEILDAWFCAEESAETLADFAAWCGKLRRPQPLEIPDSRRLQLLRWHEPWVEPINPTLKGVELNRRNTATLLIAPTERDLQMLLKSASEQWATGEKLEALETLEIAWLKRDSLPQTGSNKTFILLALQLADWYRERQEFASELAVREWYQEVVDAKYNVQLHPLDAVTARARLARARVSGANSDRARELAARRQEAETKPAPAEAPIPVLTVNGTETFRDRDESGRERMSIYANENGVIMRTVMVMPVGGMVSGKEGKYVYFRRGDDWESVPVIAFGPRFYLELNPQGQDSDWNRRHGSDPLARVRPIIARECALFVEPFKARLKEYVQEERASFEQGVAAALAAWEEVHEKALRFPDSLRMFKVYGSDHGPYDLAQMSRDETEWLFARTRVAMWQNRIKDRPWLLIRALRDADPAFLEEVLRDQMPEALKAGAPEMNAAAYYPLRWSQYLGMATLAELAGADTEAPAFVQRQRERAAQVLAAYEGLPEELRRSLNERRKHFDDHLLAVAIMIHAHSHPAEAAELLSREDVQGALSLGLYSSKEDLLRCLLDMRVTTLSRHANIKYLHYMTWKDQDEVKSWVETHGNWQDQQWYRESSLQF